MARKGPGVLAKHARQRAHRRPFAVAFVIGSMVVAARFTENNRFCGTDCHEMWPYRDSWKASTHQTVDGMQCHIPPGPVNFVVTKLYASREVWVHFTGQVKAPIAVTRHIPNSACERSGCHTGARIAPPVKLGTAAPVDVQARQRRARQEQVRRLPRRGGARRRPRRRGRAAQLDGLVLQVPYRRAEELLLLSPAAARRSGSLPELPQPRRVDRRQELRASAAARRYARADRLRAVPHQGRLGASRRLHQLPRRPAQRAPELRRLPRARGVDSEHVRHPQEGPHVPAGDEPLQCGACHQQGFGKLGRLSLSRRQPADGGRMTHRHRLALFDIDCTLIDAHGAGGRAILGAVDETYGVSGSLEGYTFHGRTDPGIVVDLATRWGRPRTRCAMVGGVPRRLRASSRGRSGGRHGRGPAGCPGARHCARGGRARAAGTAHRQHGGRRGGKLAPTGLAGLFASGPTAPIPPTLRAAGLRHRTGRALSGHRYGGKEIAIIGDTPARPTLRRRLRGEGHRCSDRAAQRRRSCGLPTRFRLPRLERLGRRVRGHPGLSGRQPTS